MVGCLCWLSRHTQIRVFLLDISEDAGSLDVLETASFSFTVPLSLSVKAKGGVMRGGVWNMWHRLKPRLDLHDGMHDKLVAVCMDGAVVNYDVYQKYIDTSSNPNRVKRYIATVDNALHRAGAISHHIPRCPKWEAAYGHTFMYQQDTEYMMRIAFSGYRGTRNCRVCEEQKKTLTVGSTSICRQCFMMILHSTI